MSDKKISDLEDGGQVQDGDLFVVARDGDNLSVVGSEVAKAQNLESVLDNGSDADGQRITGLGNPDGDQDAVNSRYMDGFGPQGRALIAALQLGTSFFDSSADGVVRGDAELGIVVDGADNVQIGRGAVVISPGESDHERLFHVLPDGTDGNIYDQFAAPDPDNPRIDLLTVRIADEGQPDHGLAEFFIVEGTADPSPSAPSLPTDSVGLYEITIPADEPDATAWTINDVRNIVSLGGGGGSQNLESVLNEGNDADGAQIKNLADGSDPQDAATLAQIQALGGTPSLAQVLGEGNDGDTNLIKNLGDPVDPQDAATKAYVDAASAPTDTTVLFTEVGVGEGNDLLLPIVSIDQDSGPSIVVDGDHTARLPRYVPILINGDLRTAYVITYDSGPDQTTIQTDNGENPDPVPEIGDGVLLPTIYQAEIELPPNSSVEWVLANNQGFGGGGSTASHGWLWIADLDLTRYSIRQEVIAPPDPFPFLWQWPRNTLFRDGLPEFALFDDVNEATSIAKGIISYPAGTTITVRLATLESDGSAVDTQMFVTVHHHFTETVAATVLD